MNETEKETKVDLVSFSVKLMEPAIEDIFISKRVIMSEGVAEEDIDKAIADLVERYSTLFDNMTNKEFGEYTEGLLKEIEDWEKKDEETDIDEYIMKLFNQTQEEHIKEMYDIIDVKVKEVFLIKRGLLLEENVSQDNLKEAILDKAREANEYYTNMDDDEICDAMNHRVDDIAEPYYDIDDDE